MNHLRFAIVIILSAVLPLSAQSVGEAATREGDRLAWFIQTGIPEGLDNPVMVMVGEKIELVTLSNRLASGPVKIPADGIIRLVRQVQDPADPEKSIYLTLAEARVPESMDQALVILVPSAADPSSNRLFHAKVQGLAQFKGGDSLYLNLTKMNILVEIGERKIPLKPGNFTIHNGKAGAGANDVPFRYSYFHPSQEKWKVLSASVTIMSPTRREIVVFSVDGNTNRVKCNNITFPVPQ
jgi:hypothetical protein